MRKTLIAVAASGVGALVGWAFTADIYESKMKSNQRLLGDIISRKDNEIEGYRKLLHGEWQQEGPMAEAATDLIHKLVEPGTMYSDIAPSETPFENSNPDFPPGETEEETRDRLKGIIEHYNPNDDEVDEFVDLGSRVYDVSNAPPVVISHQKFAMDEDFTHFDKLELKYYPRERVLLDDDDEVIEDVENTVGWRNLQQFGFESNNGDVVYIRNWRMETDFEVTRYTETAPPAHVRYGMDKETYNANKAAGTIRFRGGDM